MIWLISSGVGGRRSKRAAVAGEGDEGGLLLVAGIEVAAQGADDEDASAAGEDGYRFEEGAELLGGVVEGEEFLHLIEQEDEAGFGLVELLEGLLLERGIGLAAFLDESWRSGLRGCGAAGSGGPLRRR